MSPQSGTTDTRTVATLRNQAREAERALRWSEAAELYALAADRYTPRGALAQRDIAGLRSLAQSCAQAVAS